MKNFKEYNLALQTEEPVEPLNDPDRPNPYPVTDPPAEPPPIPPPFVPTDPKPQPESLPVPPEPIPAYPPEVVF